MFVCYLDFDGVLHDSSVWLTRDGRVTIETPGRRLFEWETILIDLLEPHPQVELVLSTSWVRTKTFNVAKHQLHPSVRSRVRGATYDHRLITAQEFTLLPCGMQIWGDVLRRQPSDWFAIDDSFGWPAEARDKLVLTKGVFGLSELAIQVEIRRRLERWDA
jgi:hypothetical protein